jgi:hypothetical protein
MEPNDLTIKLTIAKLIELAYSKNSGLTTAIFKEVHGIRLTVDSNGNAMLMAKVGAVTFSGMPALERIGASFRAASISFNNRQGANIGYRAAFQFSVIAIEVDGVMDIEKLILACSGLLCKAARLLKSRQSAMDKELAEIMGH